MSVLNIFWNEVAQVKAVTTSSKTIASLFKWKLASSPQLLFEIFSRFLNGHLNSPTGRNVQHLAEFSCFVLLFPFNLLFYCTVCSHNYGPFMAECEE